MFFQPRGQCAVCGHGHSFAVQELPDWTTRTQDPNRSIGIDLESILLFQQPDSRLTCNQSRQIESPNECVDVINHQQDTAQRAIMGSLLYTFMQHESQDIQTVRFAIAYLTDPSPTQHTSAIVFRSSIHGQVGCYVHGLRRDSELLTKGGPLTAINAWIATLHCG